jgi:hypothetical protein
MPSTPARCEQFYFHVPEAGVEFLARTVSEGAFHGPAARGRGGAQCARVVPKFDSLKRDLLVTLWFEREKSQGCLAWSARETLRKRSEHVDAEDVPGHFSHLVTARFMGARRGFSLVPATRRFDVLALSMVACYANDVS